MGIAPLKAETLAIFSMCAASWSASILCSDVYPCPCAEDICSVPNQPIDAAS